MDEAGAPDALMSWDTSEKTHIIIIKKLSECVASLLSSPVSVVWLVTSLLNAKWNIKLRNIPLH